MDHVMIDLETLSTRPDAVVLSIGALEFALHPSGPVLGREFSAVLDLRDQIAMGRHVDMDTVAWWAKQSPEARNAWADREVFPVPVYLGLVGLNDFIQQTNPGRIWAHGVVFDVGILESLYRQVGNLCPWSYGAVRDARTVVREFPSIRLLGTHRPAPVAHEPVSDCARQIEALWEHWPVHFESAAPDSAAPDSV